MVLFFTLVIFDVFSQQQNCSNWTPVSRYTLSKYTIHSCVMKTTPYSTYTPAHVPSMADFSPTTDWSGCCEANFTSLTARVFNLVTNFSGNIATATVYSRHQIQGTVKSFWYFGPFVFGGEDSFAEGRDLVSHFR